MKAHSKVCLITGGANGIGRCIAESFLASGARVAIVDTDAVAGRRLARRFADRVLFVHGDNGWKYDPP